MTIQKILKRAYKAVLSTKHEVKIDEDEIDLVIQAVADGQLIRVRQGVINPSYLATIIEDTERRDRFLEDTKHHPERRKGGLTPLRDIVRTNAPQLKAGSSTGG